MGKVACICVMVCFLTPLIVIFPLSLVTHKPKLYIDDIYIPALKNSTGSNAIRLNTFIFIDLKLENVMRFNGLRYGNINLTFFYGGKRSLPVAYHTLPGFYQGLKKTANKRVVVRTRGLPWEEAFRNISSGSTVVLGVDLLTTVKLRRCGVYTKRQAMMVGGDVRVDGSGEDVYDKDIRLK